MTYKQPNWEEAIATLSGGPPANIIDLQAVLEHLREIGNVSARKISMPKAN